jgi:hypothetical protein
LIILRAVSGISDFDRAKGVLFSGSELQVPIPALTVGDTKKSGIKTAPPSSRHRQKQRRKRNETS